MIYLLALIAFLDAAPDAMPDAVIVIPVTAEIAAPIPDPESVAAQAVPVPSVGKDSTSSGCANGQCGLPARGIAPKTAPVVRRWRLFR